MPTLYKMHVGDDVAGFCCIFNSLLQLHRVTEIDLLEALHPFAGAEIASVLI